MTKDNPYIRKPVPQGPARLMLNATRQFFKLEAAGGIVLVLAAIVALVIANSPLYGVYDHFLNGIKFRIGFDDIAGSFDVEIKKSILLWINDGFMAIFFFLVGLEIKREIKTGELSSRSRALLPTIAAIGGMAVPAALYWFINKDVPENINGWAIPAATDIAFALGVLSLLGSKAPVRLKILLTAIAVIDDLGAILIIAFFYSHGFTPEPLYFGAAAIAILAFMNWRGVVKTGPYILLGIILWVAVLKSGVHATLAGVITALFIPISSAKNPDVKPCEHLEHALHPWVAFGILPLFAFANAGVPFTGMGFSSLFEPVTLGIIVGLVVGKQLGIFTCLVGAIKSGLCPMPGGTTWKQLYGVSALCGIGFTMSLFIGGLAFHDLHHQASIRLGVLTGSVISAIIGFIVLKLCRGADAQNPAKS
jgi:NhaA family Na+:H+ antiporter